MKLKPIDQQVVVVMGASSGIGRETALRFARQGAKVVVSARGEAGLASLVDEVRREGGEATAIPADVAEFAHVKAVADGAVATYGRLDTWVHCAAVSLYARVEDTTPEEFKRVVDVTFMGHVHGAMAALPHLKQTGQGALIHVSSIEARRALPLSAAYAAAKHAIDGFLESLRVELRHDHVPVSVTQILPASINTPLFNNARTKLGVKPMPPPPIYEPGTVADVILYAATHPARDLYAGGAGKAMIATQRLSPSLMDAFSLLGGFRGQRTNEPRGADAPNNLYGPIADHDQTDGDFSQIATPRSLYNWLETHRAVRWALLAGTTLGTLAAIGRRSGRGHAQG